MMRLLLSAEAIATKEISLSEGLGYSLLGVAVVFFMLLLLMAVIKIMGALLGEKPKKAEAAPAPAAAQPAEANGGIPAGKVPAPGSLGEIAIHDVPEKTAAMIMAIVADELNTPLNELRFKSIKRVD